MKKFAIAVVVLALSGCLFGCGGSGGGSDTSSDDASGSNTQEASPAISGTDAAESEDSAKTTVPTQYWGTWDVSWLSGSQWADYSDDAIRATVEIMSDQKMIQFIFGADSTMIVQGTEYDFELLGDGRTYQGWIPGDSSEKNPFTLEFNSKGELVVDLDGGVNIYTFSKTA